MILHALSILHMVCSLRTRCILRLFICQIYFGCYFKASSIGCCLFRSAPCIGASVHLHRYRPHLRHHPYKCRALYRNVLDYEGSLRPFVLGWKIGARIELNLGRDFTGQPNFLDHSPQCKSTSSQPFSHHLALSSLIS